MQTLHLELARQRRLFLSRTCTMGIPDHAGSAVRRNNNMSSAVNFGAPYRILTRKFSGFRYLGFHPLESSAPPQLPTCDLSQTASARVKRQTPCEQAFSCCIVTAHMLEGWMLSWP